MTTDLLAAIVLATAVACLAACLVRLWRGSLPFLAMLAFVLGAELGLLLWHAGVRF